MENINNICDIKILNNLHGEKWMPVLNFEGIISVSNFGRVRRHQGIDSMGRPVKERILTRQYRLGKRNHICGAQITFGFNGINYHKQVSRLVAESFFGTIQKDNVVIHLNKNIFDDRLENLKMDSLSNSLKLDYKLKKRSKIK